VAKTTEERARRLVHVKYAAAALEECHASLHEAVAFARSAGVSWVLIAEALDISREAALDRFGSRDSTDAP
jgi:hypothetical protein